MTQLSSEDSEEDSEEKDCGRGDEEEAAAFLLAFDLVVILGGEVHIRG